MGYLVATSTELLALSQYQLAALSLSHFECLAHIA
jgi:hypothetical protein